MWRQRRLRALEAAALAYAEHGGTNEPEGPSLATLTRYRARVGRDLRLAEGRLAAANDDASGTDEPEGPAAAPSPTENEPAPVRLPHEARSRTNPSPPPRPAAP